MKKAVKKTAVIASIVFALAILAAIILMRIQPTASDHQRGVEIGRLIENDSALASELKRSNCSLKQLFSTGMPDAIYVELVIEGERPVSQDFIDKLSVLLQKSQRDVTKAVIIRPSDPTKWSKHEFTIR